MVDDATRPVAIDNSPIIENEGFSFLKNKITKFNPYFLFVLIQIVDGALVVGKNALENLDYTVVHSRVWKTLRKW